MNSPPVETNPFLSDAELAELRADCLAGHPRPMWKEGYQCVDIGTVNAMRERILDLVIELQEHRNSVATPLQQPAPTPEEDSDGPDRDLSHWAEWPDEQLIDQAAAASQSRVLLDDAVVREAIAANVIAPLRQRMKHLEAEIEGQRQQLDRSGLLMGAFEQQIRNAQRYAEGANQRLIEDRNRLRVAATLVLDAGWNWLGDMTEKAAADDSANHFMSAMESLRALVPEGTD